MADLLSIGKTGLNASKKSLETTGHNIANANTEGYSRQRVHQTSGVPTIKGGLLTGTGARSVGVNRIDAPLVEKRLEATISEKHFFGERVLQLDQIENVFNEINAEGLSKVLNKFFNSFRELANNPENETMRSVVRDNARLVVKDFRRIRSTLDNLARNIDKKLDSEIKDINQQLHVVANINKKIVALEAGGQETGDLRDQREVVLRALSESLKIHTYEGNKNHFFVAADGAGTLVGAAEVQELAVKGQSKEDSSNNMSGSAEVFFKGKPSEKISGKFFHGRLQSLFKTRNEDIRELQDAMDNVAYQFIQSVNAVHRRGYVNRKAGIGEDGSIQQADNKGPLTGINFFKEPTGIENAALFIDLDSRVKSDISNIVTGLNPNSPGDNRIAISISKLQHEKIMKEGTATLEEDFLRSIGNVGLKAGKARLDSEQSEGIFAQTKALKERITGVSIDEEAADMVRYQQAYEASAKVLQTADEMMKTVLNIKR